MKGEQHTVVVESLANSGDGVSRIQQKVVFIPFAVPGDKLLVEITVDKKSFSKAKIVKIIEPSPERIDPPCPYFGRCGGCDWQNVDYPTQLYWKKKNLVDVLEKIGGLQNLEIVQNPVPSPKEFYYRNRIQVHKSKSGLYFNEKGSRKPVYIDKCLIASKAINESLTQALEQRAPKIEIAEMSTGIEFFKVNSKGESQLSFRQVNTEQNQFLIDKCLHVVESTKSQKVVDLYCGQGNWSVALKSANPELECIGIELNPIAVQKAKKNEREGLTFLEGAVEEIYPNLSFLPDLAIIDPPRAGCDPTVIHTLSKNPPRFLIYISCHPATLARDIKQLLDQNWQLEEVIPVDMFPHTSHLETWCLLRSET